MVTKLCPTPIATTRDLWAAGTAKGNNCIPAVRGRAPAAVRVGHKPTAEHEFLVLFHEDAVSKYHANVMRIEALRALRAANVDSAFRDLDAKVLSQAVCTGAVVTSHDIREAVTGVP